MYRYVQSPEFLASLQENKNILTDEKINKFLTNISGSPRRAKKAHPLKKPFSKFNIWLSHLEAKGGGFFTILYLICDDALNSCSGNNQRCKHFIKKCEKPTEQIVLLDIQKGEPYSKLQRFYS